MKNLMNRILVVLALSAVFAGNISAAAAAPMANDTTASAKMALDRLTIKGPKGFAAYSDMNRKKDAATLRAEVPSVKDEIAVLEAAVLTKDASKRAEAFAPKGKATHALAAIKLALLNDDLKNANAEAKANPTPENIEKLAIKQAQATAAVSQVDESTKGYNALVATIGVTAVVVTGFAIAYGAPAWLAPYVPQYATDIANVIYTGVSSTGAALGLQEGGKLYNAAATVRSYLPSMPNVRQYLPSRPSMETLTSAAAAMKSYFSNNPAADAQAAAERAAADAEDAKNAAREAAMDAAILNQ
jgi:hypothetical protein